MRNPGVSLSLDWLACVRVNQPATQRRVDALPGRRTVKNEAQAAWLLKAVTCIDLTTLNGDDTSQRVKRLCGKARHPIREDILQALGMDDRALTVGAVCVYHRYVATAVEALEGSGIPVAAVSTGFPAGLVPHDVKLREIAASVTDGAKEIDIVITREHVLAGNWQALYDEIRDFRAACGDAHLKAILATGEIRSLGNITRASLVCMMAGADFIKTSTGNESINATLPGSLSCCVRFAATSTKQVSWLATSPLAAFQLQRMF
jgi:deoxyribose-phosphate aldolase